MRNRLLLLSLLLGACAHAADDPPGWLKDLPRAALPQYGPKVNTVVLFNEENNTVATSGRVTSTVRTAIRILNRQGGDISFSEQYDTASGKVRDFRAWMIAPTGKIKRFGKDEILDAACAQNDVYNECRLRMVSGRQDAEAGAVFAYEATVERELFSNQLDFHFQSSSPVRLARLIVTVPQGWEVKTSSFNGAPMQASPSGGTFTWQMENLAEVEHEEAAPSFQSLVPWVGVNVLGGSGHPVVSWPDASRIITQLNDGRAEPNAAMVARARQLIAGTTTELERIQALGKFAQQVNYVSIQVNLGKGGGYQPHVATQVFEKLYGDCKDKANLMRALLKAIGITAYPVAIYSGDRTHVEAGWPSLGAFNHAITAIRVGPDTVAPAVFEDPKMGRLLLFDPTDPYVPAGFLPEHEQASLALIGAGDAGGLIRVPAAGAIASARERTVEATLSETGAIEGSFVDKRSGEELPFAVAEFRTQSKTDYIKMIERWVGRSMPGSATSGVDVQDAKEAFTLKGMFSSRNYAKRPQPGMLIFRAALLRHGDIALSEKDRKYPIVLDADVLSETVRIALPPGFKVDEVPDPLHLNSPFGRYDATWGAEGGQIVFRRNFAMPAQTVPVAQYAELKKFLEQVHGSTEQPVVLLK